MMRCWVSAWDDEGLRGRVGKTGRKGDQRLWRTIFRFSFCCFYLWSFGYVELMVYNWILLPLCRVTSMRGLGLGGYLMTPGKGKRVCFKVWRLDRFWMFGSA
jgi:hypothetical protein